MTLFRNSYKHLKHQGADCSVQIRQCEKGLVLQATNCLATVELGNEGVQD